MKTGTVVVVCLAVVVGALLFIGWSRDATRGGAVPAGNRSTARPADDAARRGRATAAHASATDVVYAPPPPGARLSAVVDTLRAAADAGDARAQCRLAFELYRCAQLPALKREVEQRLSKAAAADGGGDGDQAGAADIAPLQAMVGRDTAICRGLEMSAQPAAWQYGLRAAKSGHLPSILRFVLQPPLDEQDFGKDLAGWQAYREWAGPLLVQAAERGNPTATYHLFLAYSGFPMPGGTPILAPNDELALTYAIVSQALVDDRSVRVIQRRVDKLESRMDAGARARAEDKARQLLATRYAGDRRRLNIDENPIPQSPVDCEQP